MHNFFLTAVKIIQKQSFLNLRLYNILQCMLTACLLPLTKTTIAD